MIDPQTSLHDLRTRCVALVTLLDEHGTNLRFKELYLVGSRCWLLCMDFTKQHCPK